MGKISFENLEVYQLSEQLADVETKKINEIN
jgi:hypothetical protein